MTFSYHLATHHSTIENSRSLNDPPIVFIPHKLVVYEKLLSNFIHCLFLPNAPFAYFPHLVVKAETASHVPRIKYPPLL